MLPDATETRKLSTIVFTDMVGCSSDILCNWSKRLWNIPGKHRLFSFYLGLAVLVAGCAHPEASRIQTSPKLEILDQQIKINPNDAQPTRLRMEPLSLSATAFCKSARASIFRPSRAYA